MQLQHVVDVLRPEFADRIAFLMVDLTSAEGQQFAARFGVRETTLVFFDRTGNLLDRRFGVPTVDGLRATIRGNFRF